MYKGSSVSYPRELLCMKPWINLIPDTWNANSPEDATEPFETQVAFVQPQTAVEMNDHHLQLWQTKDRQKIETEQSHPTRIVRHDLWISVLFSVEKRFAPSQWVPVGPLQIPPRHMLDFSQQGCLAPDKEILIHGDLSGKHRAVQSTRLPASFWVTGRYWVVLENLSPISVVVFAYAWNQWAGSVATTRAVTHVTLATKKIHSYTYSTSTTTTATTTSLRTEPQQQNGPCPARNRASLWAVCWCAWGEIASWCRHAQAWRGMAVPREGEGEAVKKSCLKRYTVVLKRNDKKSSQQKALQWHTGIPWCGQCYTENTPWDPKVKIQNVANPESGTKIEPTLSKFKHISQTWEAEFSKTPKPRFFSELNILANKKTLLYHPASLVLLQFFLKQGHPFLAVIGMGWHSTNFPN